MEVEFDDPKLQRVAEDSKRLVRQYGAIGAKRTHNRPAQWAADLEHPKRIVIRPTPPAPRKPDGRIDWAEVRRVTVVEFVDYH